MVINTNITAQASARLLGESQSFLSRSLSRLSSGSKIVSPEDDAAGLAVSMRFDAQLLRINGARSNLNNAVSFSQTQDGFMKKVAKALDRMGELAMLAQDATKTDSDRGLYDAEFTKLGLYIDDLATKDFNGVSLFSAAGSALAVTTDSDGNKFTTSSVDLTTGVYTQATSASVDTVANSVNALTNIQAALTQLATDRANVGANISVMQSYSEQLGVLNENLSNANSRIKDVDVAEESTQYARYNILSQAGTAMLAQANQTPQTVLRLIQ